MTPLIRIQPTKDGGRRMLTEEAKATFAAWLKMMHHRWESQLAAISGDVNSVTPHDDVIRSGRLSRKCDVVSALIFMIDQSFGYDAFDAAYTWVLEVMYGKPDDPAGGGTPGDAVGPSPSPT